nr:hypothetical protein [Flavisolibacter sp.]
MKNSVVLFLVILLLSFESGNAQQFGGFPPYFRWKQINSDTSRIIFQGAAAEQAERIATIIHRMAADTSFQLGSDIRKIDVLLHNRSTTANAFVALGPFRSEFYLVPGSSIFDFGNVAWQENLAIHEYRHVQQYSNFNNGLTKVFSFLLGEQGQDFANALTIPNWFFEGDAVFAETVFSPQGRGRLPYFLSGYKSLFAEGKNYSWMKLRNGSFKDYIPNHYQLGYILADYGYANYGADFWKQVTRDASGFKGLIYPFQKAVKKYAGIDFKAFRTAALNAENKKVQQERDVSTSKSKVVTNYFYPQFISTDSLIYLKSAFNKIPAFYILSGGKETKIALQNISQEEWFSYRSGMIAYTAFSTHPRWSLLNYSDIILLDIHSGKERKLTSKGRYYTPDLSPSLEKIVAVKMNDSLQSELRLIDITDGSTRALFPPNETDFFIQPRFVEENKIVVSVRNQQSQIALKLLDISTGKWEEIIPYSHHTTGLPFVSGSSIYFVSNLNGNDDVFSYDIKTKIISQLTADQTGNYYPAVSGDAIVWSHFTTSGLQLKRESLNGLQRRELAGSAWSRQPSVHV